jgi:hypothetical protein
MRRMKGMREEWQHMRRTLQKHERSNAMLVYQHANYKQDKQHHAKPTTKKHWKTKKKHHEMK